AVRRHRSEVDRVPGAPYSRADGGIDRPVGELGGAQGRGESLREYRGDDRISRTGAGKDAAQLAVVAKAAARLVDRLHNLLDRGGGCVEVSRVGDPDASRR